MASSSSQMTMEYLPDDVLIMICKYLTGEELAAMCATSRLWRNRLNEDIYWRWRCNIDLAQYLRDTECVVEPAFVSPKQEDSGLSDVCEWRLNYMRQIHLHNNWLNGRNKKHCIKKDPQDSFFCKSMFYNNDFVIKYSFVGGATEEKGVGGRIQIWNVKSKPFLESECIAYTEHDDRYKYINKNHYKMFTSGDFVVLVQRTLVQVFFISESHEIKLKHAFHFTHSEKLAEPYSKVAMNDYNYTTAAFSTLLMGRIFLGILLTPKHNKTLHVWNAETGVKLKEEVIQDQGCVFDNIYNSNPSKENRAVVFVKKPDSTYKIVIYNVAELSFKGFSVVSKAPRFYVDLITSLGQWIVFVNKQFLAMKVNHNSLDLYNIDTNQLVQTYTITGSNGICTYGNNIAFVDDEILKSVNVMSSEVQTIYNQDKGIYLSSAILDKFLLFFQMNKHSPDRKPRICYVKDKNTTVIRTLRSTFDFIFSTNACFSKVLSVQAGSSTSMYNFW